MMKFLHFPFLLSLISPVLCHRVLFTNACETWQKDVVNNALSDIQLISTAAAKQSEGGRGKAHIWFGTPRSGEKISDENINTRFHKFSRVLSDVPKKDVTFDCTGSAICCSAGSGAVPACGDQPGDDHINLCKPFWNWHVKQRVFEIAKPKALTNDPIEEKYRSYAYVLLHELLHSQYGARDVNDTVKDVFGKTSEYRGYGHYCVLKYAQKNPTNARKNADTYALFALAAYYGIDNFQTDPDKLR